MNLPMNLNDIDLWEKELLKGFALPLGFLPEIGEVVNILEPFKRLTIFEPVEKDGETTEKKVTVGIIYRSDGLYAWDNSRAIPNEYDEAIKWSPASQLPEYAIRRKAIVTKFEYKPLRSFFGWTMLHKMIPSFLWRNICPSRTLSCCMAGGSSTIKRP